MYPLTFLTVVLILGASGELRDAMIPDSVRLLVFKPRGHCFLAAVGMDAFADFNY